MRRKYRPIPLRSRMLIGYWAAIFAALLILPPDDGLARAQGLDKNAQEQVLMELEAAELKANETFSRSVPPRTSLSDAKDKGYVASRAAAITYDEESESFLRTAIAWFRWAALQGDGSAAEELAHNYRELGHHHVARDQYWWSHFKLDEKRGEAYRALSCKWYRRAADAGNQAALGYANWGACRGE